MWIASGYHKTEGRWVALALTGEPFSSAVQYVFLPRFFLQQSQHSFAIGKG
jgi:hypothetical protein